MTAPIYYLGTTRPASNEIDLMGISLIASEILRLRNYEATGSLWERIAEVSR